MIYKEEKKKLSITSQLAIGKGKEHVFGVGVMNREDYDMTLGVKVNFIKDKDGCTTEDCDKVDFFYSEEVNNDLSPTESKVFYITATAPTTSGTYLYELLIPGTRTTSGGTEDIEYARQTFFVKVN